MKSPVLRYLEIDEARRREEKYMMYTIVMYTTYGEL